MQKGLVVIFIVCLAWAGVLLFATIEKQNRLTELRIQIPTLSKELKNIQEENRRLRYEIEHFESPLHLVELSRKPEFAHLKFPYKDDVITLP